MAKWGGVDFDELKKFTETLQKTADKSEEIAIACLKETAARLLAKVIEKTPTGKYSDLVEFTANIPEQQVEFTTRAGKAVSFKAKARQKTVSFVSQKTAGLNGGTLKRGWTATVESEAAPGPPPSAAEQQSYLDSIAIEKSGNIYKITIDNPVPYAPYVENGHRTANKKGWVQGKFMLRISENELRGQIAPILEEKMEAMLREAMENG